MSSKKTPVGKKIYNRYDLSLTILAVISVILLIALIIPVLYISQYAYPWADDFTYSWTVRAVYASTGNPIKAILQALRCAADQFMNWQGTYTSCFLMACQPAVFGTRCYHITAYIMLGSIIISNFLLSYSVIVRKLKAKISFAVILSSAATIVMIENVKGQAEAFTWYNSAVHYTFIHSLFVLFLACMILSRSRKQKLLTMVLGFLAAGGNNITVFGGLLFLVLFELFMLFLAVTEKAGLHSRENAAAPIDDRSVYKKSSESEKRGAFSLAGIREDPFYKKFLSVLPFLIIFAIGAILNLAAPGNKVRLSGMGGRKESIISTILMSFKLGAANCVTWFNGTTLFLIVTAIILTALILRKTDKNCFGAFRFQYPLLVGLMSFCLFSALNAPIVYTSGMMIMLRVNNAIYYVYVLLIVFNCFYITGNLCLRKSSKSGSSSFTAKHISAAAAALLISFAVMLPWNSAIKKQDPTAFLTDSALYSTANGGASYYGYVMQENTNRLKSDAADVKVMRMGVDPSILYPHDAEDWISGTRLYYSKNSVDYE